ncbi:hypothetical protein D3C78_1811810 [compost metagenome]
MLTRRRLGGGRNGATLIHVDRQCGFNPVHGLPQRIGDIVAGAVELWQVVTSNSDSWVFVFVNSHGVIKHC